MIPYGRQQISEEDIESVVDVLRSDFLTQGPVVPQFEQAVCDYTGAKFAVAVNSGTSALHIACLALGLQQGDWLWTTPITFVASANCGLYCGAQVDFVDIDPLTWNLSISVLEEKLAHAKTQRRLPKIVVAVHFAGLPCEMERIRQLSKEYGFSIIGDACHAMGGCYQGVPIGAGAYSDITIFSFHPVKNITTGEGGMTVTNSAELAGQMKRLRSHGITSEPQQMTRSPDGPWYYQQIGLGFNYRMTDLQAALGLSQLKKLDEFIASRRRIATTYDYELSAFPLQLPYHTAQNNTLSGLHLYVVRLQQGSVHNRKELLENLRACGINVHVHYIPVYAQPYYQQFGYNREDFPEAEKSYSQALTLPIYPSMGKRDQQTVIAALHEELTRQTNKKEFVKS